MHELAEQLRSQLKAVWRHRWYAAAFAWVIALVGWIVVSQIPERYQADARIHVDTQSVLRPLLSGLAVQPNLDQMVGLVSQTLVSRSNLEKVIQMAGLDRVSATDGDRSSLISRLHKSISIKGAGKENLYTISYADEDPQVAKDVVQSLLTLFVEGSLIDNRKDSESARHFIDEQLKAYREKLENAENAITEFKRRHIGLMPGEGLGYFARLEEAKGNLKRANLDLKEAENSMASIKQRLASAIEPVTSGDPVAGDVVIPETELDRRIAAMEQKLDALRLAYTEQHPDIIALVRSIDQLKEQRRVEAEVANQRRVIADGKHKEETPSVNQARSPLYQQLSIALTTAEANVAVMRTRVVEYSQRYAELQAVAGAMPQVEASFTQLTRDYELNKSRYAELLKRRDTAQISRDMDSNDAASAFRVIDPPRVVPITPSLPLLITTVLLAALGGGIGIAFVISQIKPTINDERRLKDVTGLRVLGTVITTLTESQKARHRVGLAAFLASFAGLLSVYGVIMAMLMLSVSRA